MQIPRLSTEEVRVLTVRRPLRALVGAVRVYASIIIIIAVALVLFTEYGWWLPLVLAFFLIGALQHGISILLHETVHSLFFVNKRLNDLVGNMLFAYPIGFSLEYRRVHFAHHANLGESADPDMVNYRDFPAPAATFLKKVLLDFSGFGAVFQFLGIGAARPVATQKASRGHLVGIVLMQLFILAIFTLLGYPLLYFVLWLFPLVTVAKGLAQLRNLAEHVSFTTEAGTHQRFRTFRSNLLERFFIGPLNFNYHAEHHWYPAIPYYNLPRAHALLVKHPDYAASVLISSSYTRTIKDAILSLQS